MTGLEIFRSDTENAPGCSDEAEGIAEFRCVTPIEARDGASERAAPEELEIWDAGVDDGRWWLWAAC